MKIVDYLDIKLNLNERMRKQLTSMPNPTIPRKLSRKFQNLLKKDYPVYLQQNRNWKIRKITVRSAYGNAVITKN